MHSIFVYIHILALILNFKQVYNTQGHFIMFYYYFIFYCIHPWLNSRAELIDSILIYFISHLSRIILALKHNTCSAWISIKIHISISKPNLPLSLNSTNYFLSYCLQLLLPMYNINFINSHEVNPCLPFTRPHNVPLHAFSLLDTHSHHHQSRECRLTCTLYIGQNWAQF